VRAWKKAASGLLVAFGILFGLLAVLVVAGMALVQSAWGERRLETLAAERIGRGVDVQGLRILATWPPQAEMAVLRIANPEWARDPYLLDARGLRATVDPGALLQGHVVATAAVDSASVGLQRDGQRNTWELAIPEEQSGGAMRVQLRSASIGELRIAYFDEPDRTDVTLHASGDIGREGRPFAARAEGRFRGDPLRAAANAPAVPLAGEQPVKLSFEAQVGKSRAAGALALRAASGALQSIEGRIEASGPSIAALNNVARAELPKSKAWRVAAHLRHETGRWNFNDIEARLGKSDLHGSATLEMRKERPFLRASLASKLFDFEETGIKRRVKEEVKEKDAKEQFLVPHDDWPTDGWDLLDAELELFVREMRNVEPVPLEALELRAVMENAALRVDPLDIRIAGGRVSGRLALNASESPEEANMQIDIRGLQLSRLFPQVERKEVALGRLNGRVQLTGRGDSPGAWLGNADGRLLFATERGSASGLLVEVLGLDAAEAATLLGKKGTKLPLRCAVVDLKVKNGTATASPFVIDASDTVLSVEGKLDLGKERISLTARAEPRDVSPFTLRTPVDIAGTFLDPKVKPHVGPLAGRAAAALGLAAINPLLALIPFVDPGGDPEGGCQPQKR
jgi:uncharacterized protein involved in outer membrane biogenesis